MTEAKVRRRKCYRCGARPGFATWSICADGNRPRAICAKCDVSLNRLVLRWLGKPDRKIRAERYAAGVRLRVLAIEIGAIEP